MHGFREMTIFERWALSVLSVLLVVGIWHAFPLLNIVNDEMYYVGGVLRAMEDHSLVAAIDVPYSVSFFANYLVIGIVLAVLTPVFHFQIGELKSFLVQDPWIMYMVPRMVSVVAGIVILALLYIIMKRSVRISVERIAYLWLFSSTILVSVISRTGKMWTLSLALVLGSFVCLLTVMRLPNHEKKSYMVGGSILLAFLAVANGPLNLYALIVVPVVLFLYRCDRLMVANIAVWCVLGVLITAGMIWLNSHGWITQYRGIYVSASSDEPTVSLYLNLIGSRLLALFELYPIILATLCYGIARGIRNKPLFWFAGFYALLFLLILVFVVSWDVNISLYRYFFPFSVFLIMMVTATAVDKRWLMVASIVSLLFFVQTLYLLSIPTTYNLAYNWVLSSIDESEIVVVNEVSELQLPKNRASYLNERTELCSTKCQESIQGRIPDSTAMMVIDERTEALQAQTQEPLFTHRIVDYPLTEEDLTLVREFGNGHTNYETYYSVDHALGSYLDLNYWRTRRLGKPIYIYAKAVQQ